MKLLRFDFLCLFIKASTFGLDSLWFKDSSVFIDLIDEPRVEKGIS